MLGCRSTGPDAEGEQRCRAGQGRCVAPAGKESGDYFGARWVNWVWARRRGGRRTEDARQEEEEGQVGSAKWWPAQSE